MALNIKSAEADRLARELARATGESITEAVTRAVEERLARFRRRGTGTRRRALAELRRRVSELPELDARPDDELLGYDDDGTFD